MAKGKDTHTHTKIHTYTSKLRTIDEILSFLPKIVDEIISTAMFMTLLFTYLYMCIYQLWKPDTWRREPLQSRHRGVHLAKGTQRFTFRRLYTSYVARIFIVIVILQIYGLFTDHYHNRGRCILEYNEDHFVLFRAAIIIRGGLCLN